MNRKEFRCEHSQENEREHIETVCKLSREKITEYVAEKTSETRVEGKRG